MPRIQMTNLMCLAGGGGERITIAVVNFVSVTMAAITGDSYHLPLHF